MSIAQYDHTEDERYAENRNIEVSIPQYRHWDWWFGGCEFKPQRGQFLTKFILCCVTLDLSDNLTEMPQIGLSWKTQTIVKNSNQWEKLDFVAATGNVWNERDGGTTAWSFWTKQRCVVLTSRKKFFKNRLKFGKSKGHRFRSGIFLPQWYWFRVADPEFSTGGQLY